MSVKLGDEMYLYYCAAGIGGSPAWTLLAIVKDVKMNTSKGEVDVTTRASGGWKRVIGALKEASIDFEMPWDTENAGLGVVRDAFFDDTALGLAVMDGPIDQAGSEGLWADCVILKFDRNEPLAQDATVSVTAKPTYSATVPGWKVIGE
jgi:predicted secreted protein